ncbi:peptidase [Clostridia bacterium]|nr:peptidase [Clostridia bacterium]
MSKLFDAHCDTITEIFLKNEELFSNSGHLSIEKLLAYETPTQIFAIWLPKEECCFKKVCGIISFYRSQIKKYDKYIAHADSYSEILKNQKDGKISGLLSVEGGESLDCSVDNLEKFYKKGVRAMNLTWNNNNALGGGAFDPEQIGLTEFGKNVAEQMNALGMLVDLSHLSEKSISDVLDISKRPVIASHSNARKLTNNARNLSDTHIREIAEGGGVIGINLYPPFLSDSKEACLDDALAHITHIINLAGADCVGLGCDFDGIEKTPADISDVRGVERLCYLIENTHGAEIAEKVMYKNFTRVVKDVL